jgi:heme oxygenase
MKNEIKQKIEKIECVYDDQVDTISCLITTKCGYVFVGTSFNVDDIDEVREFEAYRKAIKQFEISEAYLRKNLSSFCDTFGANTEIPDPISGGFIV